MSPAPGRRSPGAPCGCSGWIAVKVDRRLVVAQGIGVMVLQKKRHNTSTNIRNRARQHRPTNTLSYDKSPAYIDSYPVQGPMLVAARWMTQHKSRSVRLGSEKHSFFLGSRNLGDPDLATNGQFGELILAKVLKRTSAPFNPFVGITPGAQA